jgi:integrase
MAALILRRDWLGEVLGLYWAGIDADTIRIRQQVQRVGKQLRIAPVKTTAGKRDLTLLGLANDALEFRRAAQALDRGRFGSAWSDTGPVFTSGTGLPVEPRNLNRSFTRICQQNKLRRIRVHDPRHTTASLLKALGVQAKDAQVILGHAHASTTQQIYAHVDDVAKRDAIGKLNKLLGGAE